MRSVNLDPAAKEQAAPPSDRGQPVVVSVSRHSVVPGKEAEYEIWLREVILAARNAEGQRGINIIPPHTGSQTYTVVLHFDQLEHLGQWLASDVWRRLLLQAQHLLQDGDQVEIKTGLEFWFRPPGSGEKRAKSYKQFLITLSVIFPLTMLVPWLLTPLFRIVPTLAISPMPHFLVAAVVVALMTYVIMPHYTRLMAPWLYR
jgi:uncharacterized protein